MRAVLIALGRDRLIDLLISGVEILRDEDLVEDSDKDELAFDILLAVLKTFKSS